MVRVAIAGAGGRMGRELALAALGDAEIEIAGAIEAPGSPVIGEDIGRLCGCGNASVIVTADADRALSGVDVLIEFTIPQATVAHVALATQLDKGVVLGTTGLSTEDIEAVRQASHRIPIVMAPNMGVGVNVLVRLLPQIAQLLGKDYDVEIVEAHHRGKQDAPSGTALKIAEVIARARDDLGKTATFGRHGIAPRRDGEIGIHAVRAGGIVGDHRIIFANGGEQIEVIHRAFSRQSFALGALRAAKFVATHPAGMYTMQDVLGAETSQRGG